MLALYAGGDNDSGEFWITDEHNDELVGVAYCAPERMTNGTWNVLLIAVHPDYQGRGRGAALMRYVEQTLTARGERLLLVETLASFELKRVCYKQVRLRRRTHCIRDYYDAV
jgi:GNAT superfamily N-acetyltransferase